MRHEGFRSPSLAERVGFALADIRHDFLPSFVVFLVALPLCMGIAIASGMPVVSGLITGIVGGVVVGLISGSPLQVSGPAAGLTVIVYAIVGKDGPHMLAIAIFLAGLLQIVAGVLKLGQWFRAVAPAVVQGMLSGIGILIFANQFHVMFDEGPKSTGWRNIAAIPQTIADGLQFPESAEKDSEFHRRVLSDMRRAGETQARLVKQLARAEKQSAKHPERALADRRAAADEQQAVLDTLGRLKVEVRDRAYAPPRLNAPEELIGLLTQAETAVAAACADLLNPDAADFTKSNADAADALAAATEPLKRHDYAAAIGLATLFLIVLFGKLKKLKLGMIPPQLLAVIAGTAIAALFVLPLAYVDVPDRIWSEIRLPDINELRTIDLAALGAAVVTLAVVASAETLLCATAVDQMHTGSRTRYNQELIAQGVGNSLCGLLGGLPMTGVIVRSATNIEAGGRSRWSAVLHGFWLLGFVALGSSLLRMIPTSALAAVLVLTGYKLMNFKAAKELAKFGRGEVVIYFATIAGVVLLDLLSGVILGIVLSALKLMLQFAHLEMSYEPRPGGRAADLHFRGAATFLRLPILAAELDRIPSNVELHVHIDDLTWIDHACFELLFNWQKRHEAQGGRLVLDWERLLYVGRTGRNGDSASRNGYDGVPRSEETETAA